MARSAVVWLCVCAGWMAVCTNCQYLNLKEGDVCKTENGTSWTCTHIKNCSTAIDNIKYQKQYPEICGLRDLDIVACCKPERKCKTMCRKYADSVFLRLPDPLLEGGVAVYDFCYKPKTRTKRARESLSREFPHMALIARAFPDTTRWVAAGSLISELYVLTAANGVFPNPNLEYTLRVRLGEHHIMSDKDEDESRSQPTDYEVVQIILHPEYENGFAYDDIALLKLNTTVYFTEFIRPICLHTEHQLPYNYGLFTGWGILNDTPQTANLTIISREHCNNVYANDRKLPHGVSEDKMICAGGGYSGVDLCSAEEGDPLQVPLDDVYCMYSLVAISSFWGGCVGKQPGVCTKVSHYIDWIENIVWP